MDFEYCDDQQAIIELGRKILADHCTQAALQAVEKSDGPRFDAELWAKLSEAGLVGLAIPETYGGAAQGFLEIAGIAEQIGKTAAPVPFLETVVLGSMPLVEFGSEAQKQAWLPRVAEGKAIVSAALIEDLREPEEPATEARADGDAYVLSGTKICVPAGPIADLFLVPAKLGDGVAVFLVEASTKGLERITLETTSGQPEAQLEFGDVRVASDAILGKAEQGVEIVRWIELRATAVLASVVAGVCDEAVRLTAEYTKERKQFDVPIATFQAVGQRAADAFIDTEGVRLTALQAAWRIHEGLPAESQVAVAKFWAADGGARVVRAAQHLHGGVGVDREYPLHRTYLYARHIELTFGGTTRQLQRLGRLIASGSA